MNDDTYWGLSNLAYLIRWLEELVAILSRPFLMIGFIVSALDLMTQGRLLTISAIYYGWAAILAIALDATFFVVWSKVKRAFMNRQVLPFFGYALLGLALGVVVWAAIDLQSLEQALGISNTEALARLNLNPVMLTHLRSLVAVIMGGVVAMITPESKTSVTRSTQRRSLNIRWLQWVLQCIPQWLINVPNKVDQVSVPTVPAVPEQVVPEQVVPTQTETVVEAPVPVFAPAECIPFSTSTLQPWQIETDFTSYTSYEWRSVLCNTKSTEKEVNTLSESIARTALSSVDVPPSLPGTETVRDIQESTSVAFSEPDKGPQSQEDPYANSAEAKREDPVTEPISVTNLREDEKGTEHAPTTLSLVPTIIDAPVGFSNRTPYFIDPGSRVLYGSVSYALQQRNFKHPSFTERSVKRAISDGRVSTQYLRVVRTGRASITVIEITREAREEVRRALEPVKGKRTLVAS